MKKRLLSMTLCLCALMQMFAPIGVAAQDIYAIDGDSGVTMEEPTSKTDVLAILNDSEYELSDDTYEYVLNELSYLEGMGIIEPGVLEDIRVENKEKLNVYYVLKYGEIVNTVRVIEQTDINTIIEITQDDIVNILEINKEGQITLDGNKLDVYLQAESNDATPLDVSGAVNYYDHCPYGSTSDYKILYSTTETKDVQFREKISEISFNVFKIIFMAATTDADWFSTAIDWMYEVLKEESPDATSMSSKLIKYRHTESDSLGYISSKRMTVYKCAYLCYSEKNFAGTSSLKVNYYCKQYF